MVAWAWGWGKLKFHKLWELIYPAPVALALEAERLQYTFEVIYV